jgi:hypothetical protein
VSRTTKDPVIIYNSNWEGCVHAPYAMWKHWSLISDLLSFAIYQKLMNYEVQVNISFLHVLVVIEKADPYFAYAKLSTPNNEPHQHHWKSRILKWRKIVENDVFFAHTFVHQFVGTMAVTPIKTFWRKL